MSLFESIVALVEGVKSVIDVSSAAQSAISDSVSNGIEHAFLRIRKPFERSLIGISFIFTSSFLIFWGSALFLEKFVPYHGLGFVIVGTVFGAITLFFLREKEVRFT